MRTHVELEVIVVPGLRHTVLSGFLDVMKTLRQVIQSANLRVDNGLVLDPRTYDRISLTVQQLDEPI
jgi:hypothetical protein